MLYSNFTINVKKGNVSFTEFVLCKIFFVYGGCILYKCFTYSFLNIYVCSFI